MTKEVLATDLDEVFAPFLSGFLQDYNGRYGTSHAFEDFESYDFEHALGLSVADTVKEVYGFMSRDHSHLEPLEEVEDVLERLHRQYDLEIITARHPDYKANTLKWVQEKLPPRFRAVKFIGYAPVMEKPVTKAQLCHEIGAVALIDDSLSHITQCADAGIEGILFGDYPWNQAKQLPSGVTRCIGWQAVADHFNV